jgi:hypothetical protein
MSRFLNGILSLFGKSGRLLHRSAAWSLLREFGRFAMIADLTVADDELRP